MIKKLITLFKLARKIAKSDILNIASKFKKPPLAVTYYFNFYQFHFLKKNKKILIKMRVKDFLVHWKIWELLSLSLDNF